MAEISIESIKKLKELSGVGLTDAKKALVEADGDFDKALKAMREKGLTKAEKRGDRETREGIIDAYIHDGRLGAIVEVNCETSFVAKTDEFKTLAHQIAMQIASMNPLYVSEADIPADVKEAKMKELEASIKAADEQKKQAESALKNEARLILANANKIAKEKITRLNQSHRSHIRRLKEEHCEAIDLRDRYILFAMIAVALSAAISIFS